MRDLNPPDMQVLTNEEYHNLQADRIVKEIFNGEENAEKTGHLITSFVSSYEKRKKDRSLEQWLIEEFRNYPTIWKDAAELESTAHDIIAIVEQNNAAKESLATHLEKGKSRESWLAKRIEDGAVAAGVVSVGQYAERIDQALMDANIKASDALFNKKLDALGDWEVSRSPHLHGFIAENDVANQFNLNANANNSGIHAEVLGSTELNSADLVIRDSVGNVLQNVQIKSYADVDQAINNIRSHGYQDGTTLLVHKDQVEPLQRAFPNLKVTSRIEENGISADLRSYTEYKQRQHEAQIREESHQYEWNDVNRINIAKQIGKQALIGAGIAAGMQGARILGRRVWNAITGKQNPPASEDLKEFFESSLKSTKHVGVQVAVSGAVVVAVKNGWLGTLLRNTPAGRIANAVYVGLENAKILYKLAKGEITGPEAIDAMGNVTVAP